MDKHSFELTEEEAKELYDHFMERAGYVSYEFDFFIIKLIRKLREYLQEK